MDLDEAFHSFYPSGDGHLVTGLLQSLEGRARTRMQHLLSDASEKKMRTAMRALAAFRVATGRVLFRTPSHEGEIKATLYNEWTFILFAEWMAIRPSPRLGVPVAVSTIIEYISCLKGHLGTTYGFALTQRDSKRLSKTLKAMQRGSNAIGTRSKRRGLTGRHLRKAWKGHGKAARRGNSRRQLNDWAALTTAWQCLARGGELCIPTRADLQFSKRGRSPRYATLWLTPLKKRAGKATPKVPIIIAEHDGGGSDTYAALARLVEGDPQPDSAPLFTCAARHGRRVPMTSTHFRNLVKDVAEGLGFLRRQFAAHSCRIGGSIDLANQEASPLLIQAKGRWASDIGRIYCRMTRRSQLAASRLMQGSGSRDCEELFPSFTQAA